MSELINNSKERKRIFKEMILKLHKGEDPEKVKKELKSLMNSIPSGEVVEVEQELIETGLLSAMEITKLCDLHSAVLEGAVDSTSSSKIDPGHPVETFKKENLEIKKITLVLTEGVELLLNKDDCDDKTFFSLKHQMQLLMDVDKHYKRKENLLFPYLEKYQVTGPAKVMWGRQDEIRKLLKDCLSLFANKESFFKNKNETKKLFRETTAALEDMVFKEEEILFPMALDKLTISEWYDIYLQTQEIGYCLYDPKEEFRPVGIEEDHKKEVHEGDKIKLPSGSMTPEELAAILNTLPIDITFVDRHDKVRYFSQGKDRIFDRNRAILGRDVRLCHPPSSVNVVEEIVNDFKSGKADHAPFWIQMHGKFIHIEYFALRNPQGEYLGTLEMSQELTKLRSLEGEQRILNYKAHQEATSSTSKGSFEEVKSETLSWINKESKIGDILNKFPFLIDKMETISEKYSQLKNPIIRKTVAKIATIEKIAKNGGFSPDELIKKIKELIKKE